MIRSARRRLLVFEQGRVESARLAYEQAARLFAEAAHLLPAEDTETRWRYLMEEAQAEQTFGDERGNNPALVQAIASYRAALPLAPRAERPLDWAMTQNNLGNALQRLGERESGTARLEEAVAAFRAALEERTRERVPLQWAWSFGGQGIVLMLIAERTKDAGMAQTALRQIEEALETARAGGDAPLAVFYEERLSDAARIRDALIVPEVRIR